VRLFNLIFNNLIYFYHLTLCLKNGNTPLHLAAENDNANIIKMIIKINPDLAFSYNLNVNFCVIFIVF
jgi:ankyrin repeat protein